MKCIQFAIAIIVGMLPMKAQSQGGAPNWVDHPTIEVDFDDFEWAKVTNVYDEYFKPEDFSPAGYAKGIVRTAVKGDTSGNMIDHFVFFDRQGNIKLEVVKR